MLLNLASNSLKSFGIFYQPSLDVKLCVLDYRKLFTMDKSKKQSIQTRINRTLARANLPRIKDDSKMSAEESKAVQDDPNYASQLSAQSKQISTVAKPGSRAPSGRIRKQIVDPSSSSKTKPESSSSVEHPLEVQRTDTEQESDGNTTPIILQTVPAPFAEAQPKDAVAPISTKANKSKKNKKSKKSCAESQPKKTRVSGRKSKKSNSNKSKKHVHLSSSSSADSGSESEDKASEPGDNIDQVFCYKSLLYYLYDNNITNNAF